MLKQNNVNSILNVLLKSICSGLFIVIGCAIYLSCTNKIIGAVLFSIALYCICYRKYNLFTGKIGYIATHEVTTIEVILTLLGNLIGTAFFGWMLSICIPNLQEASIQLVESKLTQDYIETVIRGIFCGVLMFTAVDSFRRCKQPLVIFLCVTVFILCGFEHSIANMGYFAIANKYSVIHLVLVVAGNTLGSWIIPLLEKGTRNE